MSPLHWRWRAEFLMSSGLQHLDLAEHTGILDTAVWMQLPPVKSGVEASAMADTRVSSVDLLLWWPSSVATDTPVICSCLFPPSCFGWLAVSYHRRLNFESSLSGAHQQPVAPGMRSFLTACIFPTPVLCLPAVDFSKGWKEQGCANLPLPRHPSCGHQGQE